MSFMTRVMGRCLLAGATALLLLGRPASSVAEPLPEFYGFYAVDGGKLYEFGKTQDKVEGDFSPGVRFIFFDKRVALAPAEPSLYRLKFIRYLREPANPADFNAAMCVVKEHKLWMRTEEKDRQLELRTKPMPGQTEMVMFVPRDPLKPGAYVVAEGDHAYGYLFVGRQELFATLEASEDCADASRRAQGGIAGMFQQLGGWQDEIPCSRSTMKAGTTDRCQASTGSAAQANMTPEAKALDTQLTKLLQKASAVPSTPDTAHTDGEKGVSFAYPANFGLEPKPAPFVAFLMAPSNGEPETDRTKFSLTKSTAKRAPTLQAAVDATLKGTRASLEGSTIAGPVNTRMGGADAQIFLVTGKEAGVLRQKAVTVAVVGNHVLGAVLHATPETFEPAWDAYRRVTESYKVQ